MSWLTATYVPAAFFSLRPATSTTSGGKTLLCPTPYALKMAILTATIQRDGGERARELFPVIRDLRVAIELPTPITVLKSFAKVRRINRDGEGKITDEEHVALIAERKFPYTATIAYREFVQFGAPLVTDGEIAMRIAIATARPADHAWLAASLTAINYLGKRGGFLQLMAPVREVDDPGESATILTESSREFTVRGTLQQLDDCGQQMTFEHADIYDKKRIRLGTERILRDVVLPFRLVRSSRGYSLYDRI